MWEVRRQRLTHNDFAAGLVEKRDGRVDGSALEGFFLESDPHELAIDSKAQLALDHVQTDPDVARVLEGLSILLSGRIVAVTKLSEAVVAPAVVVVAEGLQREIGVAVYGVEVEILFVGHTHLELVLSATIRMQLPVVNTTREAHSRHDRPEAVPSFQQETRLPLLRQLNPRRATVLVPLEAGDSKGLGVHHGLRDIGHRHRHFAVD